eukprot:COSAG06_NODE_146_length_22145_cov_11.714733_4_plen_160_part_00
MGGNPRYGEQCWLLLLPACQRALPQQPSNVRDCIALPYIYENRTSRGKTQQTGEAPSVPRQQQQGRRLPHAVGPTMPSTQPLLLGLAVAAGAAAAVVASGALPAPSAAQLKMLRAGGLSQFMHFSVDPFTSIEHNCVGSSGECIPASAFDPTDVDTDQW